MKYIVKYIFAISLSSFLLTLIWWWMKSRPYMTSTTTHIQSSGQLRNNMIDSTSRDLKAFTGCTASNAGNLENVDRINKARSFEDVLSVVADLKKNVILSVLDYGLRDFALNFYISSVIKHGFKNHLFICTDRESVAYLASCNIPCFYFHLQLKIQSGNITAQNSDFGSAHYHMKTNVKTRVVLDALIYGYNVLISDLDVIILKDPFPFFECDDHDDCDIHISTDRVHYNSGFLYARSTMRSIRLYQLAWNLYVKYHKSHDQSYINMAIKVMTSSNHTDYSAISIHKLSSVQFPCGYYYFRSDFRMFNNTPMCQNCVIIHNNYIGSTAAKRYRFKENLLWYVDQTPDNMAEQYYSDTHTKYLTYYNPDDFGHNTYRMETQALKNAMMLGTALNRTLILPTFRCCNCKTEKCDHPKHKCSLLSLMKINSFDEEYKERYKEHVFLWNQMVAENIRVSPVLKLHLNVTKENNNISIGYDTKVLNVIHELEPNQKRQEVLHWLKTYNSAMVIKFEALYGDFKFVLEGIEQFYYNQHEAASFQCSDYDQWEVADTFADVRPVSQNGEIPAMNLYRLNNQVAKTKAKMHYSLNNNSERVKSNVLSNDLKSTNLKQKNMNEVTSERVPNGDVLKNLKDYNKKIISGLKTESILKKA